LRGTRPNPIVYLVEQLVTNEEKTVSAQQTNRSLTQQQLMDGYGKAVSNGLRLLEASIDLTGEFPDVALGLAEIGQEEIGKSLSILAAFSLARNQWSWFWSAWKDHQLKAHRAFLYELISPLRLEIRTADGIRSLGPPLRQKITHEKEFSFYVNFDPQLGQFVSPANAVAAIETHNRAATLLYLAVIAWHVRAALDEENLSFRHKAFSEIAFRICSERIDQQDMPEIFAEFESRSESHKQLMTAIRTRLAEGKDFLTSSLKRAQSGD
jgi:AbiV family abortive infection protein